MLNYSFLRLLFFFTLVLEKMAITLTSKENIQLKGQGKVKQRAVTQGKTLKIICKFQIKVRRKDEQIKTNCFTVKELSKWEKPECSGASVLSQSLRPRGLQPTRLLCQRDFLDKNTGAGCHVLLQRIFPTKGSNPHLPHCTGYHSNGRKVRRN